jgi:hypothetical protein
MNNARGTPTAMKTRMATYSFLSTPLRAASLLLSDTVVYEKLMLVEEEV